MKCEKSMLFFIKGKNVTLLQLNNNIQRIFEYNLVLFKEFYFQTFSTQNLDPRHYMSFRSSVGHMNKIGPHFLKYQPTLIIKLLHR
jgi:hypothetical protein